MKKTLTLVLLALPLFAMAKGSGYGNTDWGMNPAQVIAAQNGKAHSISPEKFQTGVAKVRIDNVDINSSLYTVSFLFDASDKLVQTNVISNEKSNVGIIQMEFDTLHQLLTQKYGKPQFEGDKKVTWKAGDTTIELSKLLMPGLLSQASVRYIPNNKVTSETSDL